MVNGNLYSGGDRVIKTPWADSGSLVINRGNTEVSDFAVMELIVWNRTLSSSDLWQVSSALAAKYCLCVPAQSYRALRARADLRAISILPLQLHDASASAAEPAASAFAASPGVQQRGVQ